MSKLDEIKQRWAAATPGPWEKMPGTDWTAAVSTGEGRFVSAGSERGHANAEAIAAAPEDVRWLVERVEALEKALACYAAEDEWSDTSGDDAVYLDKKTIWRGHGVNGWDLARKALESEPRHDA